MVRIATVTAPTTAIAHTGHATTLPPGTYPVAELDGVAARGEMYIEGPDDGALVRIDPDDRNITLSKGESMAITRENLTVVFGTSRHGGPMATITVDHPAFAGKTYKLKSTEGLERLKAGRGVHAFEEPGEKWVGMFDTLDMETAITWFVSDLNAEVDRRRAYWATMPVITDLRDWLSTFEDSLGNWSRYDFWESWTEFKAAVAATDVALAGRKDVEVPDWS